MDIEQQNVDEMKEKDKEIAVSYDDALAQAGLGKFHALQLLTCGLCLMATIVETLNIGFVIPLIEMECEMILTLSQKGILNSAAFVGIVTTSFFWGFLADWEHGGRKKVMHFCTSIAFAFSVISSFSTHVWVLIVTRFFVGFFISGIAANTYAYLGEFHAEKNRAKYLSFAGVFMAFALTFCPGVGWLILKFQNIATISFVIPVIQMNYSIWRIFLLLCSSLCGIVTLLLFFLPESPKFLLAQDKHDEAVKILSDIYRRNKKTDSRYPVDKIFLDEFLAKKQTERPSFFTQVWKQTSPLFKSPLLINTLRTSFIMFSLFAASSGFFMWTPDILNKLLDYRDQNYTVCHVIDEVVKLKKLNETAIDEPCKTTSVDDKIYAITFFMGSFFSLVYFVNGLVINKVGKKNLLAIWFVLCGVTGALIPWTTNYNTILFLMVIFLTCGVCGSILSAVLVDLFPTNVRAMSLCVVLMVGRIGAVAGSNFVSFLIVRECELMFGLFGGLLLASAIISILLPGK